MGSTTRDLGKAVKATIAHKEGALSPEEEALLDNDGQSDEPIVIEGETGAPITHANESEEEGEDKAPSNPIKTPEEVAAEDQERAHKLGKRINILVGGDDDSDYKDDVPTWVDIPEGLVIPKGKRVCFIRIPAGWTDTPKKGDRQCVFWGLRVSDEQNATKRAMGDSSRMLDELTMGCVRAVDGKIVNWTRDPKQKGARADIKQWWEEIGPKGRHALKTFYKKTHNLEDRDIVDFFDKSVAVTMY